MKYILIAAILSFAILSISVAEFAYKYRYSSVDFIKHASRKIDYLTVDFRECNKLPVLQSIKPGAILIVGHPYEKGIGPDYLFDQRIRRLIEENSDNIKSVIFTGDVLYKPTQELWDRFKRFFSDMGVDYEIAPGNHDVHSADHPRRTLFSKNFANPYLKKINSENHILFIEDSTRYNWLIDEELISAVNEAGNDKPIFILRHNVPAIELKRFANSTTLLGEDLPSMKELANNLSGQVSIISGDGGAFSFLPRIACAKKDNVSFIVNGMGRNKDDKILILSGGALGYYALNDK